MPNSSKQESSYQKKQGDSLNKKVEMKNLQQAYLKEKEGHEGATVNKNATYRK